MASEESDEKNLLEKSEQEADVTMTTEKGGNIGDGESGAETDNKETDLENDKDNVEIKDVKLELNDDVTTDTKEESTNEKTGLMSNDDSSSSSESEDDVDFKGKTEDNVDDRIEDMTRSLLGLDECGEMSPERSIYQKKFKRYKKAMKNALPLRFEKTQE